jgi:hypothetical protein
VLNSAVAEYTNVGHLVFLIVLLAEIPASKIIFRIALLAIFFLYVALAAFLTGGMLYVIG